MKGLTSKKAASLLKKIGPNSIKTASKVSGFKIFLSQFNNPLILILVFASVISALAGEVKDTIIIAVVLFFNAFVGFYQEFKAEKSLEALQKMVPYNTKVYRDGKVIQIPASELVPGDVIELGEGEKVPADGKVIESMGLKADEAALTGESLPVHKNEKDKVFMGTVTTNGSATIEITETGMQTEFGKITKMTVETKDEPSPLQSELHIIGSAVSKGVIGLSVLIFGVLAIRSGSEGNYLHFLIYAASLAVAAVPEGLPTTLTITLTRGARELMKKHSVVRKLNAVETLGSVSVICTDKTGTLTQNRMTVVKAWTLDEGKYDIRDKKQKLTKKDDGLKKIIEIGGLCNEAHLEEKGGKTKMIGDPTEGCLLVLGKNYGSSKDKLLKEYKHTFTLSFDSERKRMTTLHTKDGKNYAMMKGSPSSVLAKCTHIYKGGKVKKMTAKERKEIEKEYESESADALRVLGFAYREITSTEAKNPEIKKIEQKMIFVGLTGIIDPPRTDVPEAIRVAHAAGIRIFMVTGDAPMTAFAIAQQIGLVKNGEGKAYTGAEIEKMDDKKLTRILKNEEITPVFARVSPADKSRIVRLVKKMGLRVAVTGDGVNDAPALKTADIGIAMGITGTDVAKEASDIVLLNDNFAAIITAIREGRHIYANMQKFINYSFSTNSGEVIVITIAAILGFSQPLTPALLLIVNLVTDILPALSLGMEPIEEDVMHMPPRDSKSRIFNWKFIKRFLMTGLIIGTFTLGVFAYYGNGHVADAEMAPPLVMTATFCMLILFQLFNAFNSKSPTKSILSKFAFSNLWLWGAVLTGFAIIVSLTMMGWSQELLNITALGFKDWALFFLVGSSVFVAEEVFKYFRRKRGKGDLSY